MNNLDILKMESKIGIYKITNPNGKIYIGQSINIDKRFKNYFTDKTKYINQKKLYNSINKYDVKNHIFEIIELCKIEELNNKERYYQEFFNCVGLNGLNCKFTNTNDKSGRLSEETKLKIGNSNKGKKPRLGMINSLEMNLKISKSHLGKIIPLKHRINMSNASPNKKKIIDLSTNIVYNSIKEVSKIFNINYGTLKSYLKNKIPNKTSFTYYE